MIGKIVWAVVGILVGVLFGAKESAPWELPLYCIIGASIGWWAGGYNLTMKNKKKE